MTRIAERAAERDAQDALWPPLRWPARGSLRAGAAGAVATALLTWEVGTALAGATLAGLVWAVIEVVEQALSSTTRRPRVSTRAATACGVARWRPSLSRGTPVAPSIDGVMPQVPRQHLHQ